MVCLREMIEPIPLKVEFIPVVAYAPDPHVLPSWTQVRLRLPLLSLLGNAWLHLVLRTNVSYATPLRAHGEGLAPNRRSPQQNEFSSA